MRWTRIVVSALGASLALACPAWADNPASISLAGAQAVAGYSFPYSPGAVQIDARLSAYNQQAEHHRRRRHVSSRWRFTTTVARS